MRKHPGFFSFGVAGLIFLAYLAVSMGSNKNVDATTWILAFGFIVFPFVWLGVFIVVSTITWFQNAMGHAPEEHDNAEGESDTPKKPRKFRGS